MKINITTKNFDITPSIKEYIEKKMNYLDKFTGEWALLGGIQMDFEAGRTTKHHHKGQVYYAEANLKIPGGMIRAQKSGNDLRAAIDAVKKVLAEEIKEYKKRKK